MSSLTKTTKCVSTKKGMYIIMVYKGMGKQSV